MINSDGALDIRNDCDDKINVCFATHKPCSPTLHWAHSVEARNVQVLTFRIVVTFNIAPPPPNSRSQQPNQRNGHRSNADSADVVLRRNPTLSSAMNIIKPFLASFLTVKHLSRSNGPLSLTQFCQTIPSVTKRRYVQIISVQTAAKTITVSDTVPGCQRSVARQ